MSTEYNPVLCGLVGVTIDYQIVWIGFDVTKKGNMRITICVHGFSDVLLLQTDSSVASSGQL